MSCSSWDPLSNSQGSWDPLDGAGGLGTQDVLDVLDDNITNAFVNRDSTQYTGLHVPVHVTDDLPLNYAAIQSQSESFAAESPFDSLPTEHAWTSMDAPLPESSQTNPLILRNSMRSDSWGIACASPTGKQNV